jgi:hypothetical protein
LFFFLFSVPLLLNLTSFSWPCGIPAQAELLFLGLHDYSGCGSPDVISPDVESLTCGSGSTCQQLTVTLRDSLPSTRLCVGFILLIFYLQWISVLVIAKIQFLCARCSDRTPSHDFVLPFTGPLSTHYSHGLAARVFLLSVLLPAPAVLLGPAPVCHRRDFGSALLWPVLGVNQLFGSARPGLVFSVFGSLLSPVV